MSGYLSAKSDNQTWADYVRDVIKATKGAIDVGVIDERQETLTHHFAHGVYARQMDVTANTLVVSKMHRHQTINIFLRGNVTLVSEEGLIELTAPCVLISPEGTQRIGLFTSDSSWLTIHPTDTQDLDEIERQVIVPDDEINQFLENLGGKLCLGEQ